MHRFSFVTVATRTCRAPRIILGCSLDKIGVNLKRGDLPILMKIFDKDASGAIDIEEFYDVLVSATRRIPFRVGYRCFPDPVLMALVTCCLASLFRPSIPPSLQLCVAHGRLG